MTDQNPIIDQDSMITTPLGTNVLNEANGMFASAIEKAAKLHGGEKVRWGLGLMPMPTEQYDQRGQQQIIMVLALYLSIAGAQIGTNISSTALIEIDGRTQELTDQQVYDFISGALDARSRQLDQQAIDEAQAAEHGGAIPTSGLISTNGQPLHTNKPDVEERAMRRYVEGDQPPNA